MANDVVVAIVVASADILDLFYLFLLDDFMKLCSLYLFLSLSVSLSLSLSLSLPLSLLLVYVFGVVDTTIVDASSVAAFAPTDATSLDAVVVVAALAACDATFFANADADVSTSAGATNVDVSDGDTIVVSHTDVIFVVS